MSSELLSDWLVIAIINYKNSTGSLNKYSYSSQVKKKHVSSSIWYNHQTLLNVASAVDLVTKTHKYHSIILESSNFE